MTIQSTGKILAISAIADHLAKVDGNRSIEPEDMWRFTQELDPQSFGWLIMSLAHKAGYHYDWHMPQPESGETRDSPNYVKRVESSFLELTGITLSNVLANAKSWIGVWATMILDHGVTLVPEWTRDDELGASGRRRDRSRVEALDLWFRHTRIADHLDKSALSRLKAFLLEVLPQLRLASPKIDQKVLPMLVNDDTGFGIPKVIRVSVDAIREARKKNEGHVPRELITTLVTSFENDGRDPAVLEATVAEMGYMPKWVNRKYQTIMVGAYLHGSNEQGDKGIDYLVEARGDESIEFCESTFGRAPYMLRHDLGGDSDERRNTYKEGGDQPGRIPGDAADAPGGGI